MTVETTNITSGPYLGNGLLDTYGYDFRVETKNQLKVFETTDLGVETTLVVDTDYTVNDIGVDGGGDITRLAGNLPNNFTWFIRSDYKETQLTDFDSQGGFLPEIHESAFDKLTFLVQQLSDKLIRTLSFSESDPNIDEDSGIIPVDRNQTIFTFNAAGDIELVPLTPSLIPDAILEEQQTLSDGQRDVTFTTIGTDATAIYVSGPNVDVGRLTVGTDYVLSGVLGTELQLTDSYPEGTKLIGVHNEVTNTVQAAIDAAASAAAALVSENNAATSETNASNSETAAGNSASNAATSETNAGTSETNASNSAAAALVSENNAAQSAIDAANAVAATITGTSTTSITIGLGAKTWTIETGKSFAIGNTVKIADDAAPTTNFMVGTVTQYVTGTGQLDVLVDTTKGSGTISAWTITIFTPTISLAEVQASNLVF